jgi:hypothetical protein
MLLFSFHPFSKLGLLVAFLMCVCLHERGVDAVLDSDAIRSLVLEDDPEELSSRNATAGSAGEDGGNETDHDDQPQAPFWTPSAAPDDEPPHPTIVVVPTVRATPSPPAGERVKMKERA